MYGGGDASTRALALIQDPEMAALKNDGETGEQSQSGPSRGRSGYTQLGVIRTKPGVQSPHELHVVNLFHEIRESRCPCYSLHGV